MECFAAAAAAAAVVVVAALCLLWIWVFFKRSWRKNGEFLHMLSASENCKLLVE